MPKTNFENLDIYQLSEQLADTIWHVVRGWNRLEQDTVGKQVIRSADSIGANIAEGSAKSSSLDYKRFLEMSLASSFELETPEDTVTWKRGQCGVEERRAKEEPPGLSRRDRFQKSS